MERICACCGKAIEGDVYSCSRCGSAVCGSCAGRRAVCGTCDGEYRICQ